MSFYVFLNDFTFWQACGDKIFLPVRKGVMRTIMFMI